MCLTKVYYNTYSDGSQDVTEKNYPCRDGRSCSRPDVRRYDRKFPFNKLGDAQPESHRSLSERKPTPYFSGGGHTPRGSKSPSPSGRRDSGVYMGGGSHSYDYRDPYAGGGGYDAYGYHTASSRHDPRDRYGREREREPRLKRSSTTPHIVYMDRDGNPSITKPSRSRSHSSSRDYSHSIPVGLVPLADDYGSRRRQRRHSSSASSSRSHSREGSDSHLYYPTTTSSSSRRRTDDPQGYLLINDQDEKRSRRRRSSYTDAAGLASSSAGMAGMMDGYGYTPRRASTVVHHSDGSVSTGGGSGSSSHQPKQLRWEDQVRERRNRQNAEIASRSAGGLWGSGEVKGILKHTGSGDSKGKGKGREMDEVEQLRRSIARMELPRGRDREPRGWDGYGEDIGDGGRRKRSKMYADDRYRY